jgi:phage-related protein
MNSELPVLRVRFFRTQSGREPVRDWLLEQDKEVRKLIGEDIKLVQLRWPLGMPLVRKLEAGLWEVRTNLAGNRISRVFFLVNDQEMVLLHSFIKKSEKTPLHEIELARNRKNLWYGG